MTVMSDLCAAPLAAGEGKPLNIAGYAGYRFAVQVALVSTGSLLGTFVLGTSVLGGPRWVEVTGDLQGLSWERGGEPADRPIAGELRLRLLNKASAWSPWQSPFYGPGTLLRVVIGNGVLTKSQFTGLVKSWEEAGEGLGAYQWIDIIAWEVNFALGEVNDNALAAPVGAGETLALRVARLMTKAAWQFLTDVVSTTPATFQSTDLAQDVLTLLYLTVDSVDCVVWPGKDGRLKIRDRAVGTGVSWTLAHADQNPDSVATVNDDERILSSVDLARVGGAAVTYLNAGLDTRYQRRSTKRTDLITVAEAGDADLNRVSIGILARARQTYRPKSFDVESGQPGAGFALLVESDLEDRISLDKGPITFANYAICGYTHNITVRASGIYWSGTIRLDIEANSGWYQGTPTPDRVGQARVGRTRVGFV